MRTFVDQTIFTAWRRHSQNLSAQAVPKSKLKMFFDLAPTIAPQVVQTESKDLFRNRLCCILNRHSRELPIAERAWMSCACTRTISQKLTCLVCYLGMSALVCRLVISISLYFIFL